MVPRTQTYVWAAACAMLPLSQMRSLRALSGLLILLALGTPMPAFVAAAGNMPTREPLPGQIVIDPEHPQWLKRQGGEHLFICGPGDPEDFLYVGSRNPDGTRDGDQVQRIRKLIEHGGNCIYMQIVRTHGGDAKPDRTHNPFVDSDPAQGVDPDILDQWEEWFTLMDRHDILLYLFFYDDGARPWDAGGRVGPEEKAFLETVVKRFQHHRNLIWVVGEESEERYSTARVQAIAEVIRQTDEHGHLIGDHHLSGTTFKAWQPTGALNHFAMQFDATGDAAHAGAVEALRKAAGRYQVIYAESTAMRTDEDGMRRHAWAVAMGGLMPMLLRMDIASTPVESLRQCRYLQQFFEATDFYRMAPHDELRHGETQYVLGDPGRSYIPYADSLVEKLGVKDLPGGRCEVTWLDCRSGRTTEERHTLARAGDHAFDKPPDFGPECAAWIRFPDRKSNASAHASFAAAEPASSGDHPPLVQDQRLQTRAGAALYIPLKFEDNDGVGESKIATVTIAVSAADGLGIGATMAGPLRVHPANPRYFTDGSGKAIYLTGSHTWNNLQYNGVYPRVECDEYLDFLTKHNHNFIRGLNTAFMDLYGASRIGDKDVTSFGFVGSWAAQHDTVRKNMAYTRMLAERMKLAAMMPRGDMAGASYCLANPGKDYLVYLPQSGEVTVNLSAAFGTLTVEWLDPCSGDTWQGQSTSGGERRPFQPPFSGDAVLYLRSVGPQNAAATGRIPASPVLAQAARGIEAHRKGDAAIRLLRKDGTDASDVKITVTQRTHDFAFGNVFRPRHYRNEAYRTRFLELFNFVQLLEFNWGQYETEEGKPKRADRMEFINGWCREHGLTRFYGHMLVWSPQNNSPDRPNIPHWLFRHDRPTQDRLLKKRIQREVLAYPDVDILWDVVNEAVHCRRWGDWEKQGYMDEPIPDVVPYVRDAFRWAHEANPQARLLLNDYRVIPQGKYRDRYIELIERLQNEKTPVHAVGIQAHDPYKGAYWFSPEEIWQTCEQFGAQTGLPVHFTEFCYLSDSAQDIRGTYRQGKWDLHKQAEAIEEFYRIAFGHPAVASITYFGMGDDDPPWLPNLCLLDKDFQPKPAWNLLKRLIQEEWNTRRSGNTDATGMYHFRGFFGQYDVQATDGDKQQTFRVHLERGKPNTWSFTLSSMK